MLDFNEAFEINKKIDRGYSQEVRGEPSDAAAGYVRWREELMKAITK